MTEEARGRQGEPFAQLIAAENSPVLATWGGERTALKKRKEEEKKERKEPAKLAPGRRRDEGQ